VARKGANRPIFEGETPLKKMYPQYWRRYWRHNWNPVKRHPSIEKGKNETTRTFAVKKEIFRPLTQPSLIDRSDTQEQGMLFNPN
jgi:hypothetical protein